MPMILLLLSISALLGGIYFIRVPTQEMMGAGALLVSAVLAVYTRIAQAEAHQNQNLSILARQQQEKK